MINHDHLIEALREEVQEYGELLSLFNDQQRAILDRDPTQVLVIQDAISKQLELINACRKRREHVARELAVLLGQPPTTSVKLLIEVCTESVRPLLHALINEINGLISKVRRRGNQNQMLLARSIEVSQQILQRLNPGALTKTYSKRGQITLSRGAVGSKYLARS
jgi:flagellar biosynthesis/type III secretory pathway chaperone